jgi:agmatinase
MSEPEQIPVVLDPTLEWFREKWISTDTVNGNDSPTFGFLSIPFDYAVSHRPGCRFGPEKILEALNACSLYCADKRVSLSGMQLVRYPTVDVVHSLEQSYSNIRQAVANIPNSVRPIILGGDHSITDPAIRGMFDRKPNSKIGIIVFDAHFDSREPTVGKEHSGHWMHTLADTIDYAKTVQIGINAPIYSETYLRTAEEAGVLIITPYDVRRQGWKESIQEAIFHASNEVDGIYLSVDIDSIDLAYAPGTSVPNVGGLMAHEILDAVFEIAAKAPVIGMDITEVSPPLDQNDMTSKLAAQIVLNFLAGVVTQKARSIS